MVSQASRSSALIFNQKSISVQLTRTTLRSCNQKNAFTWSIAALAKCQRSWVGGTRADGRNPGGCSSLSALSFGRDLPAVRRVSENVFSHYVASCHELRVYQANEWCHKVIVYRALSRGCNWCTTEGLPSDNCTDLPGVCTFNYFSQPPLCMEVTLATLRSKWRC